MPSVDLAQFIPNGLEFTLEGDIVFVGREGGEKKYCFPVAAFREVHRRAEAVLAAHDASTNAATDGQPIAFRRTTRTPAELAHCHDRAIYTNMLPAIDIDGGLAFLVVTDEGHCVCTTIHNFHVFLEEARREVVAWHARQGPVLPFKPPH